MVWIPSHSTLREHPKLKRLARSLGISRREAIGLLHCLWWWAMDYAPDGYLNTYTAADVADGLDWEGDPDALMAALREAGFADEDGRLHDWEDYGGSLLNRRLADAARKRTARRGAQDGSSADGAQDVQRTSSGRPTDVQRTSNGHPADVQGTSSVEDIEDIEDIEESVAAASAAAHSSSSTQKNRSNGRLPPPVPSLVGYYVDQSREAGLVVTSTDKARTGRALKEVAAQGVPEYVIRAAIDRMVEKRLGPHLLGQLVNEVEPRARPSPEEHEQLVREMLAKARGEA